MSRVASPWPEETYESPTVDRDLLAGLEDAVATITSLHEAYLVTRRSVHHGREKVQLGIVAHVGGRWRAVAGSRPSATRFDPSSPIGCSGRHSGTPRYRTRLVWWASASRAIAERSRRSGLHLPSDPPHGSPRGEFSHPACGTGRAIPLASAPPAATLAGQKLVPLQPDTPSQRALRWDHGQSSTSCEPSYASQGSFANTRAGDRATLAPLAVQPVRAQTGAARLKGCK
jgi:hypothetical protein